MIKSPRDIRKPSGSVHPKSEYILGVDLARRGLDQTAFVILEKNQFSEHIFVVGIETHSYPTLTAAIGRIMYLNSIVKFKKIYIDSTGLGSGVTDVLKEKIGNGIVQEVVFTRPSKAEMFYNLKLLLQQRKLVIPNHIESKDPNIRKMYMQFLTIQQEFTGDSEIPKIYHQDNAHDDIICALALACLYFGQRRMFKKSYYIAGGAAI